MTTLTRGPSRSSGTAAPAREISGSWIGSLDVVNGSLLSRRESKFTTALLRIEVIGSRRFNRVSVIAPAPGMDPGRKAKLPLIQNLVWEIDRAHQLRRLFDYILLLREFFLCLVCIIPLVSKLGRDR